jgi:hypothetical protein
VTVRRCARSWAVGLALVLSAVFAQPAGAAIRVVALPGFSGPQVSAAAAARTQDGGAVVAVTVPGPHGAVAAAVMRLRHDGTLDRSFGRRGITPLASVAGGEHAVAVAHDGHRIALATDSSGGGRVRMFSMRGRPVRSFGRRAAVTFDSPNAGPVAVAVAAGRVVVAGGALPCRGCELTSLDDATGAGRVDAAAAPVAGADPSACPGATVRTVLADRGRLLIAGTGDQQPACRTALAARDATTLQPVPGGPRMLPDGSSSALATAAAGIPGACVVSHDAHRTSLAYASDATAGALRLLGSTRLASGADAVAAAPVGNGACAALVQARPGRRDAVLQGRADAARLRLTRLPHGVRATTLFHCRRHVLIVGTRGATQRRTLVVAVVPVFRPEA